MSLHGMSVKIKVHTVDYWFFNLNQDNIYYISQHPNLVDCNYI